MREEFEKLGFSENTPFNFTQELKWEMELLKDFGALYNLEESILLQVVLKK